MNEIEMKNIEELYSIEQNESKRNTVAKETVANGTAVYSLVETNGQLFKTIFYEVTRHTCMMLSDIYLTVQSLDSLIDVTDYFHRNDFSSRDKCNLVNFPSVNSLTSEPPSD